MYLSVGTFTFMSRSPEPLLNYTENWYRDRGNPRTCCVGRWPAGWSGLKGQIRLPKVKIAEKLCDEPVMIVG